MKVFRFVAAFWLAVFLFSIASVSMASEYRVYCGAVPVINYMGKNHHPQGIAVDILIEIMKRIGQPLDSSDFRDVEWNDSLNKVAENPKAILVSAVLTPEREHHYRWVGPVASIKLGLIGRKGDAIRVADPASILRHRIAVIKGSAPSSMLRALCHGCGGEYH